MKSIQYKLFPKKGVTKKRVIGGNKPRRTWQASITDEERAVLQEFMKAADDFDFSELTGEKKKDIELSDDGLPF